MSDGSNNLAWSKPGWAGDSRALVDRLGAVEESGWFGELPCGLTEGVRDAATLESFLSWYVSRVLVPVELPAIRAVFEHATRYEIRELIGVDRGLSMPGMPETFLEASWRVGRMQLRRLRPLREERRVQRYARAVETRQARGWHTVVYGLAMAVFSFPMRQVLLNYGHQTIRGFAGSAGTRLGIETGAWSELCDRTGAPLRPAVDGLLAGRGGGPLPVRG
jgi:hypothetical protein